MTSAVNLDGSQLRDLLNLLGAPQDSPEWAQDSVKQLEDLLGKPLPAETRQFLLNPISLEHYDAEHPGCSDHFLFGLPDVESFINSWIDDEMWAQPYFNAVCHFLGLYPIGKKLQCGDYMYAMALLEPHSEGLGGVMYYDEHGVGQWGATISDFLLGAIEDYWKQCDGQVDGADKDDVELDPWCLSDCFILSDYDWRKTPPKGQALPESTTQAYESVWRERLALFNRTWVASFLRGELESYQLSMLPTPSQWEEQRENVIHTYHDAMYWLFAHMLLDNQDELQDCIQLSRKNASKIVHAVADYFEANSDLGTLWSEHREKLFQMTREARATG